MNFILALVGLSLWWWVYETTKNRQRDPWAED